MVAKMAKLLEKSKINKKYLSKRRIIKFFIKEHMGKSRKSRTFAKVALVVQRIE